MQNKWLAPFLVSGLLVGAAGCPDVQVDPGEGVDDTPTGGPIVEFDPSNKIIPFPNNLLLDPATGKVNLPMSCNESAASMATRVGVLNKLDGFGTFETVMTVTFTEPVDLTTVAPNVVLYKRTTGTMAVDPTSATPIPVVAVASMTQRFDLSCMNPAIVAQVILVPRVPLEQKSTYVVALKSGIKTAMGAAYGASFTWSLVRQEQPLVTFVDPTCVPNTTSPCAVASDRTPLDPSNPEDLASLNGIGLLQGAHAKAMTFLRGASIATEDVLLAWEYNTQTTTDPLDPAVAGSPAAMAAMTGHVLNGIASAGSTPLRANAGADGQTFLRGALPAGSCQIDGGPLPCQAVGEVLAGAVVANQFQSDTPNAFDATKPIPGQWTPPNTPTVVKTENLSALITVPAAPCAAAGCPTIIFQHGLGSSRTSMFAIASQFAGAGFATVSIDAVAHGSRARRISSDAAKGCADAAGPPARPNPSDDPQCYALFLSPNLGATRDNIRQSMTDLHSTIASVKACGTTACGLLKVDPTKIVYAGISLGGIMGSAVAATNPDIKAAALNVPGVGWVDILENTQTLAIRCSLVDGLIGAGILTGMPSSAGAGALCLTDEWKTQPGYRQFSAIGRWVLDPADPANFTRKLAAKRFLIQEVVGDLVVPNVATDNEAALTGLMAATADKYFPVCTAGVRAGLACGSDAQCPGGTCALQQPPSAAITTMPMTNKFTKHVTLAPDAATSFAGNIFGHASLLRPPGRCSVTMTTVCGEPGKATGCPATEICASSPDGNLGTARLQTDLITFLVLNR